MFTVYFQERQLTICDNAELENINPNSAILFPKSEEEIAQHIEYFKTHSGTTNLAICTESPEEGYKILCSGYTIITAAGGVIENENGEILLILRNAKWDLPKGKQEDEESAEETAIREVCEECGIDLESIRIDRFICTTAHTYNIYGPENLKHTHWFYMRLKGHNSLKPQTEENITDIVWVKREELPHYTNNTYPSIIEVLNTFMVQNR